MGRKLQIYWLATKKSVERSDTSAALESKPTVLVERKMNSYTARESRLRINNQKLHSGKE